MSASCCELPSTTVAETEEMERPWWRDLAILIPLASGLFFLVGLVTEWTAGNNPAAEMVALVLFWIGLLLGAYTFVPGALRGLFTTGKLGIALLMTISAVGAVILGYVEEAAALAFLYSIAEALEDKAMDRARSGLRSLLKLVPETATILRAGIPVEMPARE
ncbi:MAG: cation-translocating P-type ATPase, partial [Microbacteriaceae bacterium]|nr:cation-translocating P-type ATPase [Microbacteriaceae bacterium]